MKIVKINLKCELKLKFQLNTPLVFSFSDTFRDDKKGIKK